MKSIAIVSNCQSHGLAQSMQAMLPSHHVETFNLATLVTPARQRRSLRSLSRKDLVFTIDFNPGRRDWSGRLVARTARRSAFLPAILFWGFHPDLTYLPEDLRGRTHSPLGDYHSIIVLAGFLSGRSVRETVRLFNPLVYARLGYFDAHASEMGAMVSTYDDVGIDIRDALANWHARGCFMHSPNHPMAYVIDDLARHALRRMGISAARGADLHALPDTLAVHPQFPIYPEIGARLGLDGSLDFKPASPPGTLLPSLGLEEFVERCFACYAVADPEQLAESVGLRKALRELAG